MTQFKVSTAASVHSQVHHQLLTADSAESAVDQFLSQNAWDPQPQVTAIVELSDEPICPPKAIRINRSGVFGASVERPDEAHIEITNWAQPVQYFVGRNGCGKSKTANAIASATEGRILTTDRLMGLMNADNYGWGIRPRDYKGVPLGEDERHQITQMANEMGLATNELFALRDDPEVLLKVAAFIRRVLKRSIELRETAGFLDPYVRVGSTEYSLLRDEGHGLRELVVLLAAIYRSDWQLLIVDEPELHLHPSMARLWLGELNRECIESGRRAIIVTHEPSFLRPKSFEDLKSIWVFSAEVRPKCMSDAIIPIQSPRVTASLAQNPQLISDIVFSPRPVLLEGITDVAAFSTVLARLVPAEVVAQTDLVDCGGSSNVALWLEICVKLGLDVGAVCDLDALFDPSMQRAIDSLPGVEEAISTTFMEGTPKISKVVSHFSKTADSDGINAAPDSRGKWLANIESTSHTAESHRKLKLLDLLSNQGLWVHSAGTLEQVLNIEQQPKTVETVRAATLNPGGLDDAAKWAAYQLDFRGDLELLLGVAVERVAHSIMEALRDDPNAVFNSPVGSSAKTDSKLVKVTSLGNGIHQLEVLAPKEFQGWTLEFSRESRSTDLNLTPPN